MMHCFFLKWFEAVRYPNIIRGLMDYVTSIHVFPYILLLIAFLFAVAGFGCVIIAIINSDRIQRKNLGLLPDLAIHEKGTFSRKLRRGCAALFGVGLILAAFSTVLAALDNWPPN